MNTFSPDGWGVKPKGAVPIAMVSITSFFLRSITLEPLSGNPQLI